MTDIPQSGLVTTPTPGIDALDALATSMYASPGLYAVLLGAGMSISAGKLSAWGILHDLIRQVARSEGTDLPDSAEELERWWEERTGHQPHYGEVLEKLEPTRGARQRRLHRYFEPDGRSIDEYASHQELAELCSRGLIRVVLTTNFDDLIERVLTSKGVQPHLVTPNTISGMTPLVHSTMTVVKLHDDYRSIDIRNTPDELDRYPRPLSGKLKEMLRDFGLIVVGWSGEWDHALRELIQSNSSHTYPLYWVSHNGEFKDVAQTIVAGRRGHVIDSTGADYFFSELRLRLDRLARTAERQKIPTFVQYGNMYHPRNYQTPSDDHNMDLLIRTAVTIGPATTDNSGLITPKERRNIISSVDAHLLSNQLREFAHNGSLFMRFPQEWHRGVPEHWRISDFIQPSGDSVAFKLDLPRRAFAHLVVSGPDRGHGSDFLTVLDIGINKDRKISQEELAVIFLGSLDVLTNGLPEALTDILPRGAAPNRAVFHVSLSTRFHRSEGDISDLVVIGNWGGRISPTRSQLTDLSAAVQLYGPLTRQESTELVVRVLERMALDNGFNDYEASIERLRNMLMAAL